MNTNNLPPRLKLLFEEMKEEDKRMVIAAWERHEKACLRNDCGIDPKWIEETIGEIEAGRGADILDFALEGFGLQIS